MEFGLFVEYPSREGVTQVRKIFGCNVPQEHQIKAVKMMNEKVVPHFN